MIACFKTAPNFIYFYFLFYFFQSDNMATWEWWEDFAHLVFSCRFSLSSFLSMQNLVSQKVLSLTLPAVSALSFRCYFHNLYFRNIFPPWSLCCSISRCAAGPCASNSRFPQSWSWPFVLISTAGLSKLFLMSACTGCQLFPSSLASCFNRNEIKEFWLFHCNW